MAVRPAAKHASPPGHMAHHQPHSSVAAAPPPIGWASNEALLSRTILISGLSHEATESSLKMLFGSLGRIESLLFSPAGETPMMNMGHASIVYSTPDEAHAALRLNGCLGWGTTMDIKLAASTVTSSGLFSTPPGSSRGVHGDSGYDGSYRRPSSMSMPRSRTMPDMSPAHKNLYVLNLPLDATTDQLAALFSGFGNVVHCVILAMLDAQARRRGFIDMDAPEEAKAAIEGLNGFVWKGYPIEVSYAIVQRSGGPFDPNTNGNRTVIKRNVPRNRFNTGPRRIPNEIRNAYSLDMPVGSLYAPSAQGFGTGTVSPGRSDAGSHTSSDLHSLANDPCTLFVSGLDPVAILDDEDLRHALEPYGHINAVSLSRDNRGVSRGFGIVTFSSEAEARSARDGLDGKVINGRMLSARYLDPIRSPAEGLHRNSIPNGMPAVPMANSLSPPSGLSFGNGTYDERLRQGPLDASLRPDFIRMHSAPYSVAGQSPAQFARDSQLGEPFEQRVFMDNHHHQQQQHHQFQPQARADPRSQHALPATPTGESTASGPSATMDWKMRNVLATPAGQQHSPASTISFSSASSMASELQTPQSSIGHNVLIHGTDQVWTFPRRPAPADSPVWARGPNEESIQIKHQQQQQQHRPQPMNGKKDDVTGAIDSNLNKLRRDSPPLQPGDLDAARRAALAPVGHEKSSSPSRQTVGTRPTSLENALDLSNLKLHD